MLAVTLLFIGLFFVPLLFNACYARAFGLILHILCHTFLIRVRLACGAVLARVPWLDVA